jgi:hypothetical protein
LVAGRIFGAQAIAFCDAAYVSIVRGRETLSRGEDPRIGDANSKRDRFADLDNRSPPTDSFTSAD